MLGSTAAGALVVLVTGYWMGGRPDYASPVIGATAWAVLVLSIALLQVVNRLRALATILERSGVLSQFVAAGSGTTAAPGSPQA